MDVSAKRFVSLLFAFVFAVLTLAESLPAATCSTADELDAAKRNWIEQTVNHYFDMAQQGQAAALQANATPDFTGIAGIVSDNKDAFTGTPTLQSFYILDNSGPTNAAYADPKNGGRVEFICGIANSQNRMVGFVFPSLNPGVYAVAIQETKGAKEPYYISWILQQSGNTWKIAGLIPKPMMIGSHDGNWFAQQARAFKSKGQMRNAWLYYVMADELLRPFPAMGTPQLDSLYDEFQPIRPSDFPYAGPVDLVSSGKTYKITMLFPTAVGNDIDLVVKYQTADLSDTAKLFQENTNVINAIVAKYPEFRNAFAGVVARAVAPSGQDYGTLLSMKDVK